MRAPFVPTIFLCLLATPALAQKTTAIGTGVGVAKSSSQSGAVAISGQGGNSALTINNPANTSSTATVNSNVSGTTTSNVNQHVSGTQTLKNVPTAIAPSLAAAGIETCLGSVSGGASVVGFGGSFGSTVPDPGCNARLDARTLWNMGLKSAAVARLCLSPDIARSMPDVCQRYVPAVPGVVPVGYYTMSAESGGPIEVVEGKTGRTRMCDNYDALRQKCKVWTGVAPIKLASAKPTRSRKAIIPSPAAAPPEVSGMPAPSPQ